MPMRIVVTGASGNVGTALLRRLAAAADEYGTDKRLRHICEGADCVVHLAWGFQPTRNEEYLHRVGVGRTTALLRAADADGVRQFVHMSSVGAYAAGAHGRAVDETWSTDGIDSSVRPGRCRRRLSDRAAVRQPRTGSPFAPRAIASRPSWRTAHAARSAVIRMEG
jgi:nucleoside-diphosphate-sugar epimerase